MTFIRFSTSPSCRIKHLNYANVFLLNLKDLQCVSLSDTLRFILFHPGISAICIIEEVQSPSMWPATYIERKKMQVRPAICYIWVQLKFDQQWRSTRCSWFSVCKEVTQFTFGKKEKTALPIQFLGTDTLSRLPATVLTAGLQQWFKNRNSNPSV